MYHRLKARIGTLPINWNSNRDHDCSRYLLYDKETGQVEYFDYLARTKTG
jgi:hypothetical protein